MTKLIGLPSVDDVRVVPLQERRADSGLLGVAACGKEVPFEVRRVFFVREPAVDAVRGLHAHKKLNQFLICLAGRIDLVVDDGRRRRTLHMTSPREGVHIPPMIWAEQTYRSAEAVLLVLADADYDATDYIRDRNEFQRSRERPFPAIVPGSDAIRLNLGSGGRPMRGYVNIDQDSLDQMRQRYPGREFEKDLVVEQYSIFDLPYGNGSVDEVLADALVEHLSFTEERRFFEEAVRVLKPGGRLELSVPDYEAVARIWLAAKDDWRDFFRNDDEAIATGHWFGTHSYGYENRWGYITATLFGSQNGAGQFHKNAYSEGKLRAIAKHFGLEVVTLERFLWQGDRDPMLRLIARKS